LLSEAALNEQRTTDNEQPTVSSNPQIFKFSNLQILHLRHLASLIRFPATNRTLPDFILKFRRQIGASAAERFSFNDIAQADERERQREHGEDGGKERKELRHSGVL